MASLSQVLQLDRSNGQPLYQQLERALRRAIERRLLAPEDALPPERELAADLEVSRITVRKAIHLLASEGYLVRRQGSGNFVSARISRNFASLASFSEDVIAPGRVPRSAWLKRAVGTVSPEESLKLALGPGTTVYRFHRMRFAGEAPIAVEAATVVACFLSSIDSVHDSLYEALEKAGNPPVRALQRLRALLLTGEKARLLEAHEGDAGLLIERLGYLRDGRAVELTQSYYRGETLDFVAELRAPV